MISDNDTIAAIATPIGVGGLSIIRVSGKNAINVCNDIFRGHKPLNKMKGFTAQYGKIIDANGEDIDEVVITIFMAPHSYTAENMVEISCHGGIWITKRILETILQVGARLAQPGEFTKRAFLNGRIDLSQAEAVADLIQSNSQLSHRASLLQLEGKLSDEIKKIKDLLIDICSNLELELDFVEEGLEFQNKEKLKESIQHVNNNIKKLIDSYSVGKIYREGVRTVLVGKPNVGKSSILNNLLNENRAIVTEIAGTTRDTIEENINIGGILFKVVDTAGFRQTYDPIESEGVTRTRKQIENADLILFVLDHTQGIDNNDFDIYELLKRQYHLHNTLCIINKIDIPIEKEDFDKKVNQWKFEKIAISAKTGSGIEELKKKLIKIVTHGKEQQQLTSIVIINSRHKESLAKASHYLISALKSLDKKMSNEFITIDIRAALNSLGEIIGEITTEEVLNNIFNKFCIGK